MAEQQHDPDLAARVLKLEKTVRSMGEVFAALLALGPASVAYQIAARLGSEWIAGVVAVGVWGVVGAAFWKWYGHDLRP